ncbi:MAG: single-stranded DNA-binding protein [Clostridiales Family XIII bacterium]|jgi:single-strand DNA-binding protein|nr:single-stranded DNA-binding protein [Clostridiales Family XIII bacterium]
MNLVVIIGNLARDPEIRYGANNLAIAKFTVAVNRFSRKGGDDPGADFIRVTAFDKQAELIEKYLSKGRKVAVEGRIQTGSYDGKDGQKVYTTDVIANRVEFLGSRGEGGGSGNYGDAAASGGSGYAASGGAGQSSAPQNAPGDVPSAFAEMDDDDLPF